MIPQAEVGNQTVLNSLFHLKCKGQKVTWGAVLSAWGIYRIEYSMTFTVSKGRSPGEGMTVTNIWESLFGEEMINNCCKSI